MSGGSAAKAHILPLYFPIEHTDMRLCAYALYPRNIRSARVEVE